MSSQRRRKNKNHSGKYNENERNKKITNIFYTLCKYVKLYGNILFTGDYQRKAKKKAKCENKIGEKANCIQKLMYPFG